MEQPGPSDAIHRSAARRLAAGAAATAATVMVPLVGLALLAGLRVLTRRSVPAGARRPWIVAWWWALAPLGVLATLHALVARDGLGLLATVALLAGTVLVSPMPRRSVAAGALAALAFAAFAITVERVAAEHTFHDPARHPDMDLRRVAALALGVERFDTASTGRTLERAWVVDAPVAALSVTLEARSTGDGPHEAVQRAVDGSSDGLEVWVGVAPLAGGRAAWVEAPLALTETWRASTLTLAAQELVGATAFRLTLRLVGDGALVVRSVSVHAADATVTVRPQLPRQRLWFGGPNLLGHVAAMSGVAAIATARAPITVVAATAFAGTVVALTGSRTAAVVFAAFALALMLVALPARRRWPFAAFALVVAGTLVALLDPVDLGRLGRWTIDDRNVQSRIVEMRDAWEALAAEPLRGVGEGNLPALAHNMWLQLAGEFGAPGLLAAVWWSVAAVSVGWRRGGTRGVLVVGAFLALQVSDESWRYPGVFGPMLLAMAALWFDRAEPVAGTRAATDAPVGDDGRAAEALRR